MKMTLMIDEDVVADIRSIQESEPEKSFEKIVNELLRIGLGIDEDGIEKNVSE